MNIRISVGVVVLVGLGFVGCGVLDSDDGDEQVPPPPPEVIEGEWTMNQPDPYVVEPGMRYELVVTGVTVDDPKDVVIWLEGDVPVYPRDMRVVKDGGDDTTLADDTLAFSHFVSYVTAGSHHVALGTKTERKTGEALLFVVLPDRLPPQEVVKVMEKGMKRTLAALRRRTVGAENEQVRAHVRSYLGDERFAALEEILDGVDVLPETFGEAYEQLDSDTERALQSMLYHTGLLHWAEPKLDEIYPGSVGDSDVGTTTQSLNVTGPFDAARHPVHQAYFELDLSSVVSAVCGEAIGVLEIAFAISGVGAPVSAALTVVNVVNSLVQVVIDNFLPTDIVSVEAHDQRVAFDGRPIGWVYWGTFEPENGAGNPLSLDTIAAEIIANAIPGGDGIKQLNRLRELKRKVKDGVMAALSTILARTGIAVAEKFDFLETAPAVPIKLALNMQAYSLKISDILEKIPILSTFANGLKKLFDVELSKAIEIDTSALPSWASDMELDFDYETDELILSNANWPSGTEEIDLTLKATMYAYKTRSFLWVLRRPGFDEVKIEHAPVKLRNDKPFGPNTTVKDQDYIPLQVFDPDNPQTPLTSEVIEVDTERRRVFPFQVCDMYPSASEPMSFNLSVNGTEKYTEVAVKASKCVETPIELNPGQLNEIKLTAVDEHVMFTSNFHKHTAPDIRIPGAVSSSAKRCHLDSGESCSIRVWAPPIARVSTTTR